MTNDAQITPQPILAADPDWWRGAVIYQIYPRSFQDSTGDGIGDLLGIAQRLPYIASLGVDAIWISPFFTSPMKDFGYDVSNYCDVDPMFGTLADFDVVVETAHNLGVRVMIDLVLSHTSDQHPWFAESRVSRDNDKSDWYVWADPKPDGTAPNNWLSIFGGPAWQWDTRREQYYLHNFLTTQPDLNFHCAAVQDALLEATRFWLDRGVDGYRLDTINFYTHDKLLRDNPALPPEQRNSTIAPSVNPYNHQQHLYSKNQPENLAFLRRFRSLLNEYPDKSAVGEVGDAQLGLEIMGQYTAGDDLVHMCYAFEFLEKSPLTASRVVEVFDRLNKVAADGWACWAFSNHDVMRHASRWNLSPAALRAFTTMMMCLRGTVCLYQGEELGLPEADIAFEDLQDPYGIEFWPQFKGRDGCRTPMVWEQSNSSGGFSTGKPWLPVGAEHLPRAVALQEEDPTAILHHYRRSIAFRSANPILVKGDLSGMQASGEVLSFVRTMGWDEIFCAFNLGSDPSSLTLPQGNWLQIGKTYGGTINVLKNINLEIRSGELIVFVGPSGCGKSTLLRMIAGLEKISAGTLEIDGQVVNDIPPAQRGIAMVFQSYALYPHMTVRDNMAFALKIAGKPKAEIKATVDRVAKTLQLDELLDRLPKALSGGQRQRVAIGRSIVRDPKVYLFDEPLSNLDAALRVATRIEIAQLKEAMPGSTMVYVTHDQVEAMTLADRIVVLANKGIAQVGTPLDLYERPENEFVAQFIGSPAMNLFAAKIIGTGDITTLRLETGGEVTSTVPSQDTDIGLTVNAGVRPEDMVSTDSDHWVMEGTVDIVEALGEVTVLYFKSGEGKDPKFAKLPGIHQGLRGQDVRLTADASKVHIFHNGQSLLYR